MAKLIVREEYEGTNEQIQELQDCIASIINNERYGDTVRDTIMTVSMESVYDDEEDADTPLQARLRSELELLRPLLNEETIQRAEKIIDSYKGSSLTAEELLDSLVNEEYEKFLEEDEYDYDDCDCDDCDDDYDGFVIRVVVL